MNFKDINPYCLVGFTLLFASIVMNIIGDKKKIFVNFMDTLTPEQKKIYGEIKNLDTFKILINKIREKMNTNLNYAGFLNNSENNKFTDSDIFCFVFSYEYFYKFHKQYYLYKKNLD